MMIDGEVSVEGLSMIAAQVGWQSCPPTRRKSGKSARPTVNKLVDNVRFRRLASGSLKLKLGWLSNQLSGCIN